MVTGKSRAEEIGATVHQLAKDLGVKVAFACEVIGTGRDHARTIALSVDGQFLDSMTYKLAGTPCARVCDKGVAFYAREVARLHPEDRLLAEWEIDAYMGVALFDEDRRILGHVGVMNDGPLKDPEQVERRLRSAALLVGDLLNGGL